MQLGSQLKAVFFDIGNTLGTVSLNPLELKPFASSVGLLQSVGQTLGLEVGVITNILPEMTDADVRGILEAAGLLSFMKAEAIVTSRDAKVAKPAPEIYQFAAERVGLSVNECLYVGEDPNEVLGAQRAGMAGLLKVPPSE